MSPIHPDDDYTPNSSRDTRAQAWFWRAYLVWVISVIALAWAVI